MVAEHSVACRSTLQHVTLHMSRSYIAHRRSCIRHPNASHIASCFTRRGRPRHAVHRGRTWGHGRDVDRGLGRQRRPAGALGGTGRSVFLGGSRARRLEVGVSESRNRGSKRPLEAQSSCRVWIHFSGTVILTSCRECPGYVSPPSQSPSWASHESFQRAIGRPCRRSFSTRAGRRRLWLRTSGFGERESERRSLRLRAGASGARLSTCHGGPPPPASQPGSSAQPAGRPAGRRFLATAPRPDSPVGHGRAQQGGSSPSTSGVDASAVGFLRARGS